MNFNLPTEKQDLKNRWIRILRSKAEQYEHEARKKGNEKSIIYPDLDNICNEIEAFFVGLEE